MSGADVFAASAGSGPRCELDHLVIAAATLDDGVAWCERVLGITPAGGGRHALMGTHNRVFALGSAAFPRSYLEIIAIDPDAPPPGRRRWFDLDDPALQAVLAGGPRLVHWVARTADLDAAVAALAGLGIAAGRVLQAARATPEGELRWRIAVRDDGRRLFGGALPLLIEWGERHPCDALPSSGVTLAALTLGGPADASPALQMIGCDRAADAGAALRAVLDTPRGRVSLTSPA